MGCERVKTKLIVLPLLFLLIATFTPMSQAAPEVALRKINLPEGYIPIGIVYDAPYVWTVSYAYGAVSRINMVTNETTHYYIEGQPDTNYDWQFYGLTLDQDGNFWLCGAGRIVKFNVATMNFQVKLSDIGGVNSIRYINGYVYFASGLGLLYKYSPQTDLYTTFIFTSDTSGSYYGLISDGTNIWFSDIVNGYVYKFDGVAFTRFEGFHRPLGICYSGGYIYVAENVRYYDTVMNPEWQPAIARLDTTTGVIVRSVVVGSPYGIVALTYKSITYIAWSSSGEDLADTNGIGILGGAFYNINMPAIYYLEYVNGVFYFTFYGSNGVGSFGLPKNFNGEMRSKK